MGHDTLTLAAKAALLWFERRTVNRSGDETEIWTLKDGRPQWVYDLVYAAHGEMMPDDWKYEFAHDSLDYLADGGDPDEFDGEPYADIYNGKLLAWVASNLTRASYVDDRVKDDGWPEGGLFAALMLGQLTEIGEVFAAVHGWLVASLAEEPDDVDPSDELDALRRRYAEEG